MREESFTRHGGVVIAFRETAVEPRQRQRRFVVGETIEVRFMRHVVPEPNTGCWLWIGNVDRDGYGRFTVSRSVGVARAHRVACQLFSSPVPAGMYAMHACDTPACVNPDHIRSGTPAQNIRDCTRKGRRGHQRGTWKRS